ncbi:hypothetical protein [Micromonospora sp. NPDC049204]|uniref:hypothetical protein n=1 Tax=Micromonospora sp. NPDC049204 TaxID=3154351 RepID=UPI0033CA685B
MNLDVATHGVRGVLAFRLTRTAIRRPVVRPVQKLHSLAVLADGRERMGMLDAKCRPHRAGRLLVLEHRGSAKASTNEPLLYFAAIQDQKWPIRKNPNGL